MKRYEICYSVNKQDDPDYNCWETFAMAETKEGALEQYEKMKNTIMPGDILEGGESYIDEIGIFDTQQNEFIEKEW